DDRVAIDKSDVPDTAQVEDRERRRARSAAGTVGRLRQRRVVEWGERRPLAARCDIRAPEIRDAGDPEPLGQQCAVAELTRESPLGPVQDRLAMHADEVDARPAGAGDE